MPNHISTNFRVTGPTAEVKRFIKDAAGQSSQEVESFQSQL